MEQVQRLTAGLIRRLVGHDRQVVLTASCPLTELPVINDLLLRSEQGIVADIQPPEEAARREIIRRAAERDHCRLSCSELDRLARAPADNIRSLEGSVRRLAAEQSLI